MKKLSLVSLFGLLAAAFTVPAVADINNSDIYIINNTGAPLEMSEIKQGEELSRSYSGPTTKVTKFIDDISRPIAVQNEKTVGQALTIKPGERKKIISLGRDQNIKKIITPTGLATGWVPVAGWSVSLALAAINSSKMDFSRYITFSTNGTRHTFKSTGKAGGESSVTGKWGQKFEVPLITLASTLTYNGSKLPVTLNGLQIRSKWAPFQLYHDVEMEFNPKFTKQ